MKNELIKLPSDKVTISEQGRAAAHRLKPGDKPFVQFLAESDGEYFNESSRPNQNSNVSPASGIGDGSASGSNIVRQGSIMSQSDEALFLDIGSRLEINSPQKVRSFIIRSTTRVNLGDGPQSCETHWEIHPSDK